MLELNGAQKSDPSITMTLSNDPALNVPVAFVTIQTAYTTDVTNPYTKKYGAGAKKGAFNF